MVSLDCVPRSSGSTSPLTASDERPYLFVVDDDPDQLHLIELAVNKSKVFPRLQTAIDSQLAYERLIQGSSKVESRPDLILIDWKMPRIHGSELAIVLREHPELKNIPVVVLSSSSDKRDRAKAIESGCREFFEKPARFSDLVALMGTLSALCTSLSTAAKVSS